MRALLMFVPVFVFVQQIGAINTSNFLGGGGVTRRHTVGTINYIPKVCFVCSKCFLSLIKAEYLACWKFAFSDRIFAAFRAAGEASYWAVLQCNPRRKNVVAVSSANNLRLHPMMGVSRATQKDRVCLALPQNDSWVLLCIFCAPEICVAWIRSLSNIPIQNYFFTILLFETLVLFLFPRRFIGQQFW